MIALWRHRIEEWEGTRVEKRQQGTVVGSMGEWGESKQSRNLLSPWADVSQLSVSLMLSYNDGSQLRIKYLVRAFLLESPWPLGPAIKPAAPS